MGAKSKRDIRKRETSSYRNGSIWVKVKCPFCDEIYEVRSIQPTVIMLRIAHDHCKAKQAKMEEVGR
jgi:phage FluMu protein Com